MSGVKTRHKNTRDVTNRRRQQAQRQPGLDNLKEEVRKYHRSRAFPFPARARLHQTWMLGMLHSDDPHILRRDPSLGQTSRPATLKASQVQNPKAKRLPSLHFFPPSTGSHSQPPSLGGRRIPVVVADCNALRSRIFTVRKRSGRLPLHCAARLRALLLLLLHDLHAALRPPHPLPPFHLVGNCGHQRHSLSTTSRALFLRSVRRSARGTCDSWTLSLSPSAIPQPITRGSTDGQPLSDHEQLHTGSIQRHGFLECLE